jgi:hypothetical protein
LEFEAHALLLFDAKLAAALDLQDAILLTNGGVDLRYACWIVTY